MHGGVGDQHQVRHPAAQCILTILTVSRYARNVLLPGDPVLPGQLPLRVDVDHAALDIVPGQTRRQGLELGPELAQQCRYLQGGRVVLS